MLDNVRKVLNIDTEDDFATFYQKYVLKVEANSARNDANRLGRMSMSIEDINRVFESLNTITEELKDSELIIGRFKN